MSFAMPARSLALAMIALVVTAIMAPATATAAVAPPLGRLESVQSTAFSDAVVLTGWAVDPSARNRPASVMVTVDGRGVGVWRSAAVVRTDVNKIYSATGGHGFGFAVTIPTGQHIVCLNARGYAATSPTVSLGCFAFQAFPTATKAQMLAIARTIDPSGTINWSWTALPTGTSGRSEPWNRTIEMSSANTTRHLRAVMLHEWSHVLQYRAFGVIDPWWDAVQAFNALLGHPNDRSNYDGVEHGADCIAAALGADYLGYGCPAALRVFGARIAHGTLLNKPTGALESVRSAGPVVTVTGWALDPSRPTTPSAVQVTDNGQAVTLWTAANLMRTDINAGLGVTGGHGFQIRVTLSKGLHRLCVSAAAVASGRPATVIAGCTSVTVS